MHAQLTRCLILFALFFTVTVGCGKDPSDHSALLRSANETNIQKMRTLYNLYGHAHQLTGPKSIEQLRAFVMSGVVDRNLEGIGFDKDRFDEYLVSERDGLPLVFVFGRSVIAGADHAVVMESAGVNGVRCVATPVSYAAVSDDKTFMRLKAGKKMPRVTTEFDF